MWRAGLHKLRPAMTDRPVVVLGPRWQIVLRDLGVDPIHVLRRARLPEDLFSREGARLSVREYFHFWNSLEAEVGDPELPIRLVRAVSPEAFHPPIFAALCSSNLSVAVRRIAEYKRLVAPIRLDIEEDCDGLFVGIRWEDPSVPIPESLVGAEMLLLTQIARLATREPIQPRKVESPYPMKPAEAYARFFGVPVSPSDRHGVTFSVHDACRPFLTACESMWRAFGPELRRGLARLEASTPIDERLRSVLLETLPSGEVNVEAAARRLRLGTRTLQRSLQHVGTSYKEVVRRTREQLARHYLTNTRLSYMDISFLLGFDEPSSFFRAFREWTGNTPESVRRSADG